MATQAKFKAAAKQPAAKAEPVVKRKVASLTPEQMATRSIAGYKAPDTEEDLSVMVKVDIPHNFKLTDDGHISHPYAKGTGISMPKAHAEHFYSIANGVTLSKNQ